MATPSDYPPADLRACLIRAGNEPTPEPKPKRHVSQQARQNMARARLSLKQERFVREYAASGNASSAARKAGYRDGPGIGVTACRTLKKANVKAALAKAKVEIAEQITPGRVQRRLHEISHASQEAGQFGPAVRAEELLGRSIGLFIDRSIALAGTMNDSHIAALLELARKRQQEPIDLADDSEDGEGHRTRDDD